mgnify:CR=1 FL=1
MEAEIKVVANDGVLGLREVVALLVEVKRGNPRPVIKAFFKIVPEEGGGKAVPFRFTAAQEYYYGETFGKLRRWPEEGFWAFLVKARKAESTSLWAACESAFLFFVPGFDAAIIGGKEEHAAQVLYMMETFYNNLPDTKDGAGNHIMRPWRTHWDTGYREIGFGPMGADGRMDVRQTSSLTISTSRSRDFSRGKTLRMIHLIEKSSFSQEHESDLMGSILNGLPKNAIRIDDTTPLGMKNLHYVDFKAVKAHQVKATYLLRRWFDLKKNRLGDGDLETLPSDMGVLTLTEEEQRVARLFPQDGVPIEDRLRWRRAKMAQAVRTCLGDEQRGRAMFMREHIENDVECWSNPEIALWDISMLARMSESGLVPVSESKLAEAGLSSMPFPGLRFRAWQLPYPGGRYVGGMDVADTPGGGDASTLQVLDIRTGMYVAELYGKVRALEAVRQGSKIMGAYNDGLFAPEATGLGAPAIDALGVEGYDRLYYEEPQGGKPIKYGWWTDARSRSAMYALFAEAVALGRVTIANPDLIMEMQEFNPNEEKHWPDRLMAAMIAYAVSCEAHRFGWNGEGGKAIIPVSYWGSKRKAEALW